MEYTAWRFGHSYALTHNMGPQQNIVNFQGKIKSYCREKKDIVVLLQAVMQWLIRINNCCLWLPFSPLTEKCCVRSMMRWCWWMCWTAGTRRTCPSWRGLNWASLSQSCTVGISPSTPSVCSWTQTHWLVLPVGLSSPLREERTTSP